HRNSPIYKPIRNRLSKFNRTRTYGMIRLHKTAPIWRCDMNRRRFMTASLGVASMAASGCTGLGTHPSKPGEPATGIPPFELDEATLASLQDGMKSGKYSARSITQLYLQRIEAIDKQGPSLHSVIEINPDALQIADALDAERRSKGPRGPLHG